MFTPETLDVVMVSFEGPDQYSQAGGLGVRAREMCRAFAALGFRTTLVFVGDPDKPGMEMDHGVRLVRWCQQISARYRNGVYEGELAKIRDLTSTLPDKLDRRGHPSRRRGGAHRRRALRGVAHRLVLQVAERSPVHALDLRKHAVLLWNANNTFGFEAIDWPILDFVAAITTVSKYMKHLMWPYDVNPVVIPNGIPEGALAPVDMSAREGDPRGGGYAVPGVQDRAFQPGQTLERRRSRPSPRCAPRVCPHGCSSAAAWSRTAAPFSRSPPQRGLAVTDWHEPVADAGGIVRALTETDGAPIINLRRFLPDQVITEINVAATAVLANSGHEPFGLVGLEAMAAGGIAMVGATGEEYARPYGNAIVVETDDPAEMASALRGLVEQPALGDRLRVAARRDAADFAWPLVIAGLLERLRFMCLHQRVVPPTAGSTPTR